MMIPRSRGGQGKRQVRSIGAFPVFVASTPSKYRAEICVGVAQGLLLEKATGGLAGRRTIMKCSACGETNCGCDKGGKCTCGKDCKCAKKPQGSK